MDINQCFEFVKFVSNKTQQGNITPQQFNMLAPIAQISLVNQLLGNEQEYQPSKPLARYGMGINQKLMEDLRPIVTIPTALVFTAGVATYPVTSLYLFDLAETASGKEITPCEVDEGRILAQSVIKPPIVGNAKYYVLGSSIYVLPASIVNTLVTFVRRPALPFWDSTIINSVAVYNASSSQDFELDELLHLRICLKILQAVGVNLTLPMVSAFASQLEQQGA